MLAAFFDRYLYHRGIAQNHQCMGCSVCNVYCAFTCYQVLLLPYFSYILYHTLSIYDLSTPPFCSIQQGEIVSKEGFLFSLQQLGFHNTCLGLAAKNVEAFENGQDQDGSSQDFGARRFQFISGST